MKTVKFLLAIALALPCFLSASASDYKPMICYDRVWECIDSRDDDAIKCMKFDGTEEINGKTYHRIVTFRKTFAYRDNDTKTFSYKYENDVYENEGYLREEDGLVYTLVDEYKSTNDYDGSESKTGTLYLSSCNEPENEIAEELIYNFNCQVGETFDGGSFMMGEFWPDKFKVCSESIIEIDGESCRKISVCPSYIYEHHPNYPGDDYIEGIGSIEYGTLNYTEFIDRPTMMWYPNYFLRVLDMDANVIFDNDYSYNVPYEGGFVGVESIHEGSRMLVRQGLLAFGEDGHRNGIRIIDMGGQQAASAEKEGRVSLCTAGLAPGVYIAVASTDGNITDRRKILVSNNN